MQQARLGVDVVGTGGEGERITLACRDGPREAQDAAAVEPDPARGDGLPAGAPGEAGACREELVEAQARVGGRNPQREPPQAAAGVAEPLEVGPPPLPAFGLPPDGDFVPDVEPPLP